MKSSFLNHEKPLLCAMIMCSSPGECIEKIKVSIDQGAEALGIQLERLQKEYRTKETLKKIFAACQGRPIYVTSYRSGENEGFTDEECMDLLLLALDAGATLCDIMGDTFDPGAKYELTEDPIAVEKQKALIEEIHRRGGEVLISCHTRSNLTVEDNLKIAKAQAERGADVIKIVDTTESVQDVPGYIQSIEEIQKATDKKLLLLVGNEGRMMRYIGPSFGVCMYLCLANYGPFDTKEQPLIAQVKAFRDHLFS